MNKLIVKTSIRSIFECPVERAFKTPLLCDVSKIHTGFGIMPAVTHVTDDDNWGQAGSSKKIFAAPSLTQKGGFASMDHVLERVENKYWKFKVDQFQSWMLGFYQFVGEWKTNEIEKGKIEVMYTYHLYTNSILFYPLNWIFAQTFWKTYMKRVMKNVKSLAYGEEPYLYA